MQITGCFARGALTSIVFVVRQKPSHLHLGFTLVFAVNVTLASTISKTWCRKKPLITTVSSTP